MEGLSKKRGEKRKERKIDEKEGLPKGEMGRRNVP